MQYRQPMQVCLSTRTMPSARLNDAPVGQTSTQGGSAQCWHITGKDLLNPVAGSWTSTLRIHCGSVAGRPCPCRPFSLEQALTHSLQPSGQRFRSISMPQRTSLDTAWSSGLPFAAKGLVIPYSMTPGASATPAAAATLLRNRRRVGSKSEFAVALPGEYLLTPLILALPPPKTRYDHREGCREVAETHGSQNNRF